jgi:hypothetical protein
VNDAYDDDTEADEGDEFPVPDGTVIRLARERRS